MSRLGRRLTALEGKAQGPGRPRVIPFPTDGMNPQEIEQRLADRKLRGPMTAEEWGARYCFERPQSAGERT